ncbi:MAG: NAD(+)/NADH kinase [Ignavibacteriales bacterium]|nr:NAD(+)/NADH kinase [Ignavibacteriales bacterium]
MKFGIVGNLSKVALSDAVLRLWHAGEKRPLDFVVEEELAKLVNRESGTKVIPKKQTSEMDELVSQCDMVIAFGGDGTMLSAARLVGRASVPIVGVNLGKLGFLAEVSVDEIESFVDDILNNQHLIEDRMVVKLTAEDEEEPLFGLNDIVIDKSGSSRVLSVEAHVDNDYLVSYTGDGVIVSTPTGTTGYSLAAGGPIVVPVSEVLTISPICPHTLTARSVIVPDSSIIKIIIRSQSEKVRVTADGQSERTFTSPVQLQVQKADYTIKLVKRKDRSYYDVLRTKLMWGQDLRVQKGA